MTTRLLHIFPKVGLGVVIALSLWLSHAATAPAQVTYTYVGGGYVYEPGIYPYPWWPVWPVPYPGPIVVVPVPHYAAIAWSAEPRSYGVAFNYNSSEAAGSAAVQYCGTATCSPVVWVANGCASLSVQDPDATINEQLNPTQHGWAWARELWDAKNSSQLYCRRAGAPGSRCKIAAWACANGTFFTLQ